MSQDNSARMCQDRCLNKIADRSQDSSAKMFQGNNARMSQDKSQGRNARTSPDNSVTMSQDSNVEMFHPKSAPMFQGKNAAMSQDNSANRFHSKCVTLHSQLMENKRNSSVKIHLLENMQQSPMLKIETYSLLVNVQTTYYL